MQMLLIFIYKIKNRFIWFYHTQIVCDPLNELFVVQKSSLFFFEVINQLVFVTDIFLERLFSKLQFTVTMDFRPEGKAYRQDN